MLALNTCGGTSKNGGQTRTHHTAPHPRREEQGVRPAAWQRKDSGVQGGTTLRD